MEAIRTKYKGILFRSRAEARWAVNFDGLGIKYYFEPEGFRFKDGTCYLPDFYLPESKTFFEVKGVLDEESESKIRHLEGEGFFVAVGYSDLSFQAEDWWWYKDDTGRPITSMTSKSSSALNKCRKCGKYSFIGLNGSYQCRICGAYDGDHYLDLVSYGHRPNEFWHDDNALKAYEKAIGARFEHGEKP